MYTPNPLLDAILSCANLETKSIALIATPSEFADSSEILSLVKQIAPSFPLKADALRRYFAPCFVPHQLVRMILVGEQSRPNYEYSITLTGEQFGKPVALLALEYAAKNQHSIRPILGRSNISDLESGVTRNIGVLTTVNKSGDAGMSLEDLHYYGGLNNVRTNVQMLESAGVLRQEKKDESRQIYITPKGKTFVEQFAIPVCKASQDAAAMQQLQSKYSNISKKDLTQLCEHALSIDSPRLGGNYISHEQRAGIIYGIIAATPGIDRVQLTQQTGLHKNTVNWHLREMTAANKIRGQENNFYVNGR